MKNLEQQVEKFQVIAGQLVELYELKNRKYGDSFHKTFEEYGPATLCIRLDDKLSRLKSLLLKSESATPDESVIDTLMDTAGYAIMGIMELLGEFEQPTQELPTKPVVEDYDTEEDLEDDVEEDDLEEDEDEEIEEDEEDDFAHMSKEDLKAFLKKNKVKFHSKATRADLVKLAEGVN